MCLSNYDQCPRKIPLLLSFLLSWMYLECISLDLLGGFLILVDRFSQKRMKIVDNGIFYSKDKGYTVFVRVSTSIREIIRANVWKILLATNIHWPSLEHISTASVYLKINPYRLSITPTCRNIRVNLLIQLINPIILSR